MFRYEKDLVFKKQLEEEFHDVLDRQCFEEILNADSTSVRWILIYRSIEADSFLDFKMHHVVAQIR